MKKIITSCLAAACILGSVSSSFAYAEGNSVSIIDMINIESFVSDTPDFADGGFIYTDKYDIRLEEGKDCYYVVVFDVQQSDCLDYKIKEHLMFNPEKCSCDYDSSFLAGEGKDPWSGRECTLTITDPQMQLILDKPTKILFFVRNELPLGFDTLEAANESYGFDIEDYVYHATGLLEETLGDVNFDNKVDALDATLILRSYSDVSTGKTASVQTAFADMNKDGIVNPVDATEVLKIYAQNAMS